MRSAARGSTARNRRRRSASRGIARAPAFLSRAAHAGARPHGIDYTAIPALGGRRSPRADSNNTVWRNKSFRGYADYMETSDYRDAVDRLLGIAAGRRTALMCAEALWWQCHRALIADDLKSRGIEVFHIMGISKAVEHPYTSAARRVDGRLVYGPISAATGDLFAAGNDNE
ncbi:MAG TPA: DUF488 domain-containing protein [Gammaproteobacteria bacterium]|nr:DUF488 domain-containing protein [Gammaproteobacteria bacterium]